LEDVGRCWKEFGGFGSGGTELERLEAIGNGRILKDLGGVGKK